MPISPPFGLSVPTFITPSFNDRLVFVDIDSRGGAYKPLEIGTPHPDTGRYPGYFLVHQLPKFNDDTVVRRWYAAERLDQQNYNFEYSWPYGDENYPRLTRTFIFIRGSADTNAVVPLTPDIIETSLLLVDQQLGRSDSREIDNAFVILRRIYEKVPGVEIVSEQYNAKGEYETKTIQLVEEQTNPDADGLLVNSSSVTAQNTIVATREVVTVASRPILTSEVRDDRGDKLSIAKQIVTPGTDPTALSVTVAQAAVEALTVTKSEQMTATTNGPSQLVSESVNERGDIQTAADDIVTPGTDPTDSLLTISSAVKALNIGRSQRVTITVPSHSTLTSRDRKSGLLGTTRVVDDIVAANTAVDALQLPNGTDWKVVASTVDAISATKARRRTTEATGPISLSGSVVTQRGDVATTNESIVAPGTAAQSGILIENGVVEPLDDAKSKSSYQFVSSWAQLAGAQNKPGLLGLTTVTNDIVAPGTSPTALSTTVLQSTVTPKDATKSEKETVTATGPTSLAGIRTNQRGDAETVTESIVAAGASPDTDTILIISSTVEPIDSAKSKKTTAAVASHATLTSEILNQRGDKISIVNTIVTPGTDPDAPTTVIEDSQVKAISATKSEKSTTTSVTPSALVSEIRNARGNKVVVTNTIVAPGTDPDALSVTIEDSQVKAINIGRSEKTTSESEAATTLTSKRVSETGAIETITDAIVAIATVPAGGFLVTGDEVKAINTGRSQQITAAVASWPTMIDYEWDNEIGMMVTITRDMINITASNPAPSNAAGVEVTQRELNIYRALRTTRAVATGSLPNYDTYNWIDFDFPSLLLDIQIAGLASSDDTKEKVNVFYDIRRGWRAKVRARVNVRYFTADPGPAGAILNLKPVELRYHGWFFNVDTPALLTNGGSVYGTNGTADPKFPYTVETYTYAASVPDVTDYLAAVAAEDEFLIGERIETYRYNLWRREQVYITLK